MKIGILLLVCALLCGTMAAQRQKKASGMFSGRVHGFHADKTAQDADMGLPGVAVRMIVQGDTLKMTTGEYGEFLVQELPVGVARIEANLAGYEPYTDTMTIRKGLNGKMFYLKPIRPENGK